MHNQDTAKDDMLESILEIIAKVKDYYFKKLKDKEKVDEKKENKTPIQTEEVGAIGNSALDDERILSFQNAMKEVIRDTENKQVSTIAQSFHDNPVESMKMLQAVVAERTVEAAKELVVQSRETSKMYEEIRSSVNMDDPRALELISTLNHLHTNEGKKLELAENILSEIRPFNNESINNKEEESMKEIKNVKVKENEIGEIER